MTTTIQEARKPWQLQYINAYIFRRNVMADTWETDGVDVSRDLLEDKLQDINYALDPYAFDVGLFFSSSFTITLDNSRGRYSDVVDSRSIWSGYSTRDNSIFQLQCGYVDENGDEIYNVAFEGFLKSSTVEEDGSTENITFEIFGFENLFNDVYVQAGSLSANLVSTTIYNMLNIPEITSIMTVSLSNIVPANDFLVDNPDTLTNKTIKEALSLILLASNSVLYVDNNRVVHCTSRTETETVVVGLTSNSQRGYTDNIQAIKRFSGDARVFNIFKTEDGAYSSYASNDLIKTWGARSKTITLDFVTDANVIQTILDTLVEQFQYPKEEYEVVTDYLGDAIALLDKVYLEVFPDFVETGSELPVCGVAVCGTAVLTDYDGGMVIYGDKLFKVLKIKHDVRNMNSILYIRNVGINLSDGYVASTGSLAVCGFTICGVGEI